MKGILKLYSFSLASNGNLATKQSYTRTEKGNEFNMLINKTVLWFAHTHRHL